MLSYFQQPEENNEVDKKGCEQIDDMELVCRICLGEEEDATTNPLFSPCICAGSMGLIHLECLKEWLNNKKI